MYRLLTTVYYSLDWNAIFCLSPTDTSCSSRAPVHRLYCQGRGRVTPSHLGPCTPLRHGPSLAAAWPDHCLPSTSLTAAATGSARPCPHRSSHWPWPCCSHTWSVSYGGCVSHHASLVLRICVRSVCVCWGIFFNTKRLPERAGNWKTCQKTAWLIQERINTNPKKHAYSVFFLFFLICTKCCSFKGCRNKKGMWGTAEKIDRVRSRSAEKSLLLLWRELALKTAGISFHTWPAVGYSELWISCPPLKHTKVVIIPWWIHTCTKY